MIPVWIHRESGFDDERTLLFVAEKLLHNAQDVTILHSPKKRLSKESKKICRDHGWKIVKFSDMTGSESSHVVTFVEDDRTNQDYLLLPRQIRKPHYNRVH